MSATSLTGPGKRGRSGLTLAVVCSAGGYQAAGVVSQRPVVSSRVVIAVIPALVRPTGGIVTSYGARRASVALPTSQAPICGATRRRG